MSDAKQLEKSSVPMDLLVLYDDFTEFDAHCAFFCDAVAALTANKEDYLEGTAVQGLRMYSEWLKERSSTLKKELDRVRQRGGRSAYGVDLQ